MKRTGIFWRTIFALVVFLAFHTPAPAGTNDLFRAHVTWKCAPTNSVAGISSRDLRLTDVQLINLALGQDMRARIPSSYKLGLQCNCSNLMMYVVIYDKATKETVLTLADIPTTSYHSNGKVATVTSIGNICTNGFLLGGQLTGHLVLRLDDDQCAKKATMSTTGTLEIETTNGPVSMNLQSATLRTSGRQLRPVAQAGSGNYGLEMTNFSAPPTFFVSPGVGILNVGSNIVVGFPSVELGGQSACDATLTVSVDQMASYSFPLALCSNSVINLSSGSVLNVCTNGVTEDTLSILIGAASGDGTLNLTNCPPSTPP